MQRYDRSISWVFMLAKITSVVGDVENGVYLKGDLKHECLRVCTG